MASPEIEVCWEDERVLLEPELQHLSDDEELREKLIKGMAKSNGWGFTLRYKGLWIDVTALDERFTRVAYLMEEGQ